MFFSSENVFLIFFFFFSDFLRNQTNKSDGDLFSLCCSWCKNVGFTLCYLFVCLFILMAW